MKFYAKSILVFIVVGFVIGAEDYIDYGDEALDKMPIENIHKLYRLLLQHNENYGLGETPLEHLMIRKSQRSPSLRLRFGRSNPHLPIGIPRPTSVISSSRYDK